MHRSGTSLLANWLSNCGLDLGEQFISTDVGNTEGYFEDDLFVEFHRKIIQNLGLSSDYLLSNESIKITETDKQTAIQILKQRNSKSNQWAWKDPRTCLFINLWDQLISDLKVIAVFRHFDEVVYSLIRRKVKAEKKRRNVILGSLNVLTKKKYFNKKYTDLFIKSWIRHNQEILNYLNHCSEKNVIVLNSKDLEQKSKSVHLYLNEKEGFDLKSLPFESVFQKSLMKDETPDLIYSNGLREKAETIFEELTKKALLFERATSIERL